ncbi:MAG: O-antigen ligase family protein [Cyclobacteriaceae bacterium]|nr:O-antigen ligase family protein [Cyclobacteriaceae bacterium]
MIKTILSSKSRFGWVLFHIALGIISAITPYGLIAWFYVVFLTSFFLVIRSKSIYPFCIFIAYLTSFELLARMSQTSPFIPYELGKYLLFLMLCIGIYKFKSKSNIGLVMLLLLIPSAFFDLSGEVTGSSLIFNLMGPVNVAMAIWFFYGKTLSKIQLIRLLRMSILPLISILASTIFKTPSYNELEFTLGANFATSGGGGSNQVSTVLGLGMFISFLFLINKWNLTGYRIGDFLLFFLFGFQGLLTFSRGGILGGALGIMIVFYYVIKTPKRKKNIFKLPNLGKAFLLSAFLIIITFQVADSLTGGMLSLRYLGETEGTLAGTKEKSLNSITTGRVEIFLEDMELWQNSPVFGVGAGASSYMRNFSHFYLSHVEMSRLLSEHGLFGLIYFVLLIYVLLLILLKKQTPMEKGIMVAFFIIALYTTFHAAMRTYLTPLFIGLSLIYIRPQKVKKPVSKGIKKLEPLVSDPIPVS